MEKRRRKTSASVRWWRLSLGFVLGCVLSLVLSYEVVPMLGAIAQTAPGTVPNNASVNFQDPVNPAARVNRIPSNQTVFNTGPAGPAAQLTIVKTADKSAAEPADVVIYRLLVTNNSNVPAAPVAVTDLLPRGVQYVANSAAAVPALSGVTAQGPNLTFTIPSLPPSGTAAITYAVSLTPDSVRGSGINTATALAPGFAPASSAFQLAIRPGILADCGTIIGRVFVDKNFDGEQQSGEPGVPNAVIFMDNGNRVITDPEGLFSLANVISGNRVGALDLSSLPGYSLAPNLYRIGDNSQSRLVRLEPGGLARMNFAVTPTYGEEQ